MESPQARPPVTGSTETGAPNAVESGPESSTPPAPLLLTLQVGLSEYSADGLMGLIADRLLDQLGGPDRWIPLLESLLLEAGRTAATALVEAEVQRIWDEGAANLNFPSVVQAAAQGYLDERVDPAGNRDPTSSSTRLEHIAQRVSREAADAVLSSVEADWKERTGEAIREALKAIPNPIPA